MTHAFQCDFESMSLSWHSIDAKPLMVDHEICC